MALEEVIPLVNAPPTYFFRWCRPNLLKVMLTIVISLLFFEFLHVTLIQPRQWNSFLIFDANVRLCDDNNDCPNQPAPTNSPNEHYTKSFFENFMVDYIHPPPFIDGRRNLTSAQMEKWCPASPPGMLGKVQLVMENVNEEDIIRANPDVKPGGRFTPKDCTARQTVAVIIPYRDRAKHLNILLNNIHPILRRQQLDYTVFVVEQNGSLTYNKGILLNAVFLEAKKSYPYHCFVFHDVDLLPEDDRAFYSCPDAPRLMAVAMDKFNYKLPYEDFFGGVWALTDDQIEKINGFPTLYWGWGGEDDDISGRVRNGGYKISRYNDTRGHHKMIKHNHDTLNPVNPKRFDMVRTQKERYKTDGLNSVKYKLIDSQLRPLYTWLLIDVGKLP